MSQPFRIAHLIDTLSWGGAQKLLVTFAEGAQPYGVVPTVITLRAQNDSPFWSDLAALGVPVITFPFRRLAEPGKIIQLIRLLRRERFDVLHTHLTQANILGALAGSLSGIPVVASIHNTMTHVRRMHGPRQALEALALTFGTRRTIAVGHVVYEAQKERLRRARLVTVPNAVSMVPSLDEARRNEVRTSLVGSPKRPIIISVGRLAEQKGYADLLTAFAQVRAHHPEAALVIAGRGDHQSDLEKRLESLDLQGHAYLLGARTDVPELLAASDMFVSSSHWEGLPIAVLEAMSAGLPVVATRVGDIPYVVPPETGVVVEPKQPAQLAAAMIDLLNDPVRLRSASVAARNHIVKMYSADHWVRQLFTVYSQVCRRPVALPKMLEQAQ